MPSVSARRKTREFGVVKGVDGARVLRSGRRVWTESVEKKPKGPYDDDEWFTSKTKNSLKNHGNKENGWANGAKLKKQEVPQIRNILVNKNTPKVLPKTELTLEPKRVGNESLDGSGERNKRFGIVYSRKRKRVAGLLEEETLEGKRYRLQFSRRQRSNENLVSAPELSIAVCGDSPRSGIGGGFPCFLYLVLRYIKRASLDVSKLAAFLISEPLCSVFASSGIHFLQESPGDGAGICKFFASELFVPMLSVDFSAIPLFFANMHYSLWLRYLSMGPVINSLDKYEWDDEIMFNTEADGLCIPVNAETIEEKLVVPEVDHSRSMLVIHPSVRASKLAARNTSYKNGLNSRGIRKRRSSVRGRKARNTSLVGMHHKANGALVSDLISSRKNGVPFSSVVSKNKLRSSIRGRSGSCLKEVSSTVLAVTRGMELSKDKLASSVWHSSVANLKDSDTTAIGVTQDIDMSSCSANMLVIDLDRCSRITDATVLLETSASGECMLVVEKDGSARYTHLAQKVMKPCTSNRFTHDILWSMDENLKLEFPSRQDWLIFKDLYKECYDRNVPVSASKAIPVPGVREVFWNEDDYSASFSRPSTYICSNNDELTRALAKRTANYDMDSEDEEWLKKFSDEVSVEIDHLSEDKFELMIDSFERASYCSGGEFSDEALINQCLELGRKNVVEAVYCYWMKKRKQKRASLLRVFQANQVKKAPLIPKPVLRKRRSFNRQASQSGRGKQTSVLLAMAAEQEAQEEQNALFKVEAAKASARKAIESAIAKRHRAQLLMGNADLAIYKAMTALEIAETAQSWTHASCPPCD